MRFFLPGVSSRAAIFSEAALLFFAGTEEGDSRGNRSLWLSAASKLLQHFQELWYLKELRLPEVDFGCPGLNCGEDQKIGKMFI